MNNRNFTHGKVSYKGFPEKMCPILIAHTRFDAWVAEQARIGTKLDRSPLCIYALCSDEAYTGKRHFRGFETSVSVQYFPFTALCQPLKAANCSGLYTCIVLTVDNIYLKQKITWRRRELERVAEDCEINTIFWITLQQGYIFWPARKILPPSSKILFFFILFPPFIFLCSSPPSNSSLFSTLDKNLGEIARIYIPALQLQSTNGAI